MVKIQMIAFASPAYHDSVTLRQAIMREPLGMKFQPGDLEGEDRCFHVGAYEDDRLVGCLFLRPSSVDRIMLKQLAVATTHQRRGIGRQLLRFAEDLARARGFKEIFFHARETAVPFYEKQGYRREGERFIEFTLPHFLMRKMITPP